VLGQSRPAVGIDFAHGAVAPGVYFQ
jgi:hypothetical protein